MIITKADGGVEEFKPQKLISSLKRAGAKPDEIVRILNTIRGIAAKKVCILK